MAAIELSTLAPVKRRLINHDIMNCTADDVLGNYLYSGRALGITDPGDVLQLHPDLKSQWPAIKAHYARIGLHITENVVWDVQFNRGEPYTDYEPSVFFYGDEQHNFCRNDNWFRVVEYINSKNNFMTLAEELKMDIPKTLRFNSVSEISTAALNSFPYPCYLKAAISVSGVGIYRCQDEAELKQAVKKFAADTPVQVQEEVKTDIFLNMQYRVNDHHLEQLAATEQILDGFVHQGNRFPACCAPWHSIQPMAQWLFGHGMKGIFAFDVAVVQDKQGTRYMPIECNPRFNGASYPTLIAEKLAANSWLARSFSTDKRHLSDIDLTGIEYNPKMGNGVVIVNWGPIQVGKLLCMLVGTPEIQKRLARELQTRL
ncbi:MAG: ATP-grasp domain-containing protein [Gammaproteobacteria bacterium SG8_11]|nr:MAG: ATP-grasp domain-containing protein [Gammaproteobacteria bacterium SG8_11]